MPSLNELFAQIGAEFSPLHIAGWKQHDSSLCLKLGAGWQIRPSRDCLMWSAASEHWICLACEVRENVRKAEVENLKPKSDCRDSPMDTGDSRGVTVLRKGADVDVMLTSAETTPATASIREDLGSEPDWSAIIDWPFDEGDGLT